MWVNLEQRIDNFRSRALNTLGQIASQEPPFVASVAFRLSLDTLSQPSVEDGGVKFLPDRDADETPRFMF